jgi:hypothetical protein
MEPVAVQAGAPPSEPRLDTAIQSETPPRPAAPEPRPRKQRSLLLDALHVVSSLRVTVILFAMSIVLVFFGTWAQVDTGIWTVVHHYFRSFIAWIPLKVLTFFMLDPDNKLNYISIPYPGGWTLGTLLLINLLAAHAVRLKLTWKKSGVLILHAGLILMMVGEVITGVFAVEGVMRITEGEAVNFVQSHTAMELAILDVSDPKRKTDDLVTFYAPGLAAGTLADASLPFELVVKKLMKNSDLIDLPPGDEPQVTGGIGKNFKAIELPPVFGTNTEGKIDMPSAIVELIDKKTGASLGTRLLTFHLVRPDTETVDGRTFELSLRPKRSYRDFFVRLNKAEERKHPNTKMAKDFSSYVQLVDPSSKINKEVRIYMNNPLRYEGETYFQANMDQLRDGTYITGLQVVRNPGWTLPYLSCIVVSLGMLIHFGIHLSGFLAWRASR